MEGPISISDSAQAGNAPGRGAGYDFDVCLRRSTIRRRSDRRDERAVMRYLIPGFALGVCALSLVLAALSAPPAKQTFTGTITDDMCPKANHSRMQMGPTDAECARACADVHGASYVLYDGKNIYTLSDQQTPEKFAGQKVKVVGTLDPKTDSIQVDSITADK